MGKATVAVLLGLLSTAACASSGVSTSSETSSSAVVSTAVSSSNAAVVSSTSLPAVVTTAETSSASVTPVAPTSTTSVASNPSTTNERQIKVTVGVDSSPSRVEQIALGSLVTIVLLNPLAHDEYHLHGYDLELKAEVNEPATFSFTARKAGRFELESHSTNAPLVIIEVA